MADANQEENAQETDLDRYGAEFIGWEVLEYPKYQRGRYWYLLMGFGGLGLLIYSVATANFLFALFILMFSLLVYLTSVAEPKTMRFSVTESGIRLGGMHRSFREVTRFWVAYKPPEVQTLYIEFRSALKPRMAVDLAGMNPNEVRAVLATYAPEDLSEDAEPLTDVIGRLLKL